jgi:hypothetical protein
MYRWVCGWARIVLPCGWLAGIGGFKKDLSKET